jgi:transcriptional regulator with XRE-family HTH domain
MKEALMVGEALRMIRSRKEVTQDTLAKRTGLTINFLSRVENGKKGVSQHVAERIAGALGVPVSFLYLLGDRSDNPLVTDLQDIVLKNVTREADAPDSGQRESMYGHASRAYQPV